jgi:hypothetical protein
MLQHGFQLFGNCRHILCCEKYVQADLERRMSSFSHDMMGAVISCIPQVPRIHRR